MPHLVRFTSLKPRTIRAIILALVQHNLLWHVELEGEGEVLEFNEEECLMRLRFGRFITLAGQILGEAVRADTFTGMLCSLNSSRYRPPVSFRLFCSMGSYGNRKCCNISRSSMPKVWSQFQATSATLTLGAESSVYTQAIHALVSGAYLKPSTVLSHISKTDRLLRLEGNLRKNHKGIPTAKSIVEWKIEAEARVKRENEEAETIGMVRCIIRALETVILG